ncbi:hypothetical protein L596_010514 [Steinernema carpocapsae]|uniref:Uncharacterized protein n=1 Tax=Steinernema carpocapsae TaxID=34508 RepID=A0A4U5PIS8_STECR|nr:hypothetical protein L596_010514 [Steinernema carpocapsae]
MRVSHFSAMALAIFQAKNDFLFAAASVTSLTFVTNRSQALLQRSMSRIPAILLSIRHWATASFLLAAL